MEINKADRDRMPARSTSQHDLCMFDLQHMGAHAGMHACAHNRGSRLSQRLRKNNSLDLTGANNSSSLSPSLSSANLLSVKRFS